MKIFIAILILGKIAFSGESIIFNADGTRTISKDTTERKIYKASDMFSGGNEFKEDVKIERTVSQIEFEREIFNLKQELKLNSKKINHAGGFLIASIVLQVVTGVLVINMEDKAMPIAVGGGVASIGTMVAAGFQLLQVHF